jgi:hypothetical protein
MRFLLVSWLALCATAAPGRAQPPAPDGPTPAVEEAKLRPEKFPKDIKELISPLASTTTKGEFSLPWFPEHLVFDIRWGLIHAGQATLAMTGRERLNGRPAYHIVSQTTSNRMTDALYKVRDVNESWIDAEHLYSLGYLKHLREGRYAEDTYVLYDQAQGRFLSRQTRPDRDAVESTGTFPAGVQDVLSSLYYIRTRDLKPGEDIILDVNTGENWPLVVKIHRKETITVPLGTFNCIVAQPLLRKPGIFIQKGRNLYVWMTDDARKTPVHMTVELFIGHLSADLIRIQQKPD